MTGDSRTAAGTCNACAAGSFGADGAASCALHTACAGTTDGGTEAELIAASVATRRCIYLRRLLQTHFGLDCKSIPIGEDNQGCIAVSRGGGSHAKMRHIRVASLFNVVPNIITCFTPNSTKQQQKHVPKKHLPMPTATDPTAFFPQRFEIFSPRHTISLD